MKQRRFRLNFSVIPEGQIRFSLIQICYYGALAASAFTSAYLQELGYAASLVGVIMALVSAMGIVASPIMGTLSDKTASARLVFLFCVALGSVFYFVVPFNKGTGTWAVALMIVLLLIWAFFKSPTSSLLDSWIMRTIDRRRTFKYGPVRLMGSAGYATLCILYGRIAARTGTQKYSFFFFLLLNIPLIFLCLFRMKDEQDDEAKRRKENAMLTQSRNKGTLRLALSSYYFRMFLVSHALIGFTVFCLTTFLPYKLTEITGNTNAMGTVVAMKSYMEIPMLLFGAALMRRVNIRRLFPFIAGGLLFEEFLCLIATRVWVVTIAMMMHGFIYGLYLACVVNYVYRITPQEASASAMAIAGTVQMLMGVVGSLVGGVLVDHFGTAGYYTASVAMEAAALIVFLITYPIGRALKKPEPDLNVV